MKKSDFMRLHLNLSVNIPKTIEINLVESATDPTQDIPIRNIEVNSLGEPINVKEIKRFFSNLKIENLTTIEKRNNDVFDQLGELQGAIQQVKDSGASTNFIQTKKQQKKHEV